MITAAWALAAAGVLLAPAGPAALASAASPGGAGAAAVTGPPGGPVPAGFAPQSVTFVSASEGWVLGTAPCVTKPCTSVLRTLDGGRTWQGIPAPKAPLTRLGQGPGVTGLRFADPLDGFAYGSRLYVTHDGGATWHRIRLPGKAGPIGDLAAAHGLVYAAVRGSGARERIYRSPAGTDLWSAVAGLPAGPRLPSGGFPGPGTITLHGGAAWIFIGNRLYATGAGAAWTRLRLPCGAFGADGLAAFDARLVTLLCAGSAGAGSSAKVAFSSRNGGASFVRAGQAPLAGIGGAAAQPRPRHLLVASSSGAMFIYASRDGGRTWHTALMLPVSASWADFGFTTATQGVAVQGNPSTGSHLYMTRNGGRTWSGVRFLAAR